MPTAVATKPHAATKNAPPPQPFTRAAKEHVEAIPYDVSVALAAGSQGPYSIEVPATGYLRSVLLIVNVTGGVGASVLTDSLSNFKVLQSLTLTDSGGAPLIESINGDELALIAKYGGYAFNPDPKLSAAYADTVTTNGNFAFVLRVPVEVGNGVCALQNMNAAQPYRLNYRIGGTSDVYSTPPGTLPTVRVRAVLESWTQPQDGTIPPLLGATQMWSKQVYNVNAGSNTIKLTRVGNTYRNLLLIHRDVNGVRQSSMMPDPITFAFDQRQQTITPRAVRQHYATERYGFAASAIEAGVDAVEFTHDFDGHPGFELHDFWLSTSQASRVELQGSYGSAGTLTVLTNDIVIPASAA